MFKLPFIVFDISVLKVGKCIHKEEAAAAWDASEEIPLDSLNSILNAETLNTLKILLSRYGSQTDWQAME